MKIDTHKSGILEILKQKTTVSNDLKVMVLVILTREKVPLN